LEDTRHTELPLLQGLRLKRLRLDGVEFFTVTSRCPILDLFVVLDMCDFMCDYSHMATNLSIDPKLLEKALEVSGEKTKKAAVTQALVEFIAKREQSRIKELFGQLEWDSDYDYKRERSR